VLVSRLLADTVWLLCVLVEVVVDEAHNIQSDRSGEDCRKGQSFLGLAGVLGVKDRDDGSGCHLFVRLKEV